MTLKVKHINDIMENLAPVNLQESYDNVGLMVGDLECEVTSIMVSLDCTLEVIKEAVEKGCNLIVTHHPLLFLKPSHITTDNLLGSKIIELIKNNINVYSSHTNLDVVKGGLNDIVTEILGYKEWRIIEASGRDNDENSQGIGRLIRLDEPISLIKLCEKVKNVLGISNIRYAGKESLMVNNIAVINGSGEDYFKASAEMGADCIITGDTSYHYVGDYSEMGIGIIDAGHFETEWPAMKVFAGILKENLKREGYTNSVVISEKCVSPYKFF